VPTAGDGLRRGDIVHFGDQVSVFYADAGMEGVLDLSDTLLQCWIGGPRFCTVAESGFAHLPVRVYRWVDETDAAGSPSLPATPPDGGTIIEGKAS